MPENLRQTDQDQQNSEQAADYGLSHFNAEIENELFEFTQAEMSGIDTAPWKQAMMHKFQHANFDPATASVEEATQYAERVRDVASIMRLTNWRAFDNFPKDTVQEAYNQSPRTFDAIFSYAATLGNWRVPEGPEATLKDKDSADATYKAFINSVVHVTSGEHGNTLAWRKAGEPNRNKPGYIKQLADREGFAAYVAENIQERIERDGKMEGQKEQLHRLRQVERVFMENTLGIPPEIAKKTRRAIESRTMIFDKKNETPLPMTHKKAGIDFDEWQSVMIDMADSLDEIDSEDIAYLHRETNIVNFDIYSNRQLTRMIDLFDKDPATIQELQDQEVTALVIDANSYNTAFTRLPKWLEEYGPVIVFEVSDSLHLYKPLIRLEKRTEIEKQPGIKPSRLGVGVHGLNGAMGVGHEDDSFTISAQDNKNVMEDDVVVEHSAFGRFISRHMQPRRDTGEREVTLFSCSQAAPVSGIRRKNVPEAMIGLTNMGDRAVIRAPRHDAIFYKDEKHGVRYSTEGTQKSVFPTTEFRLASRGVIKRIQTDKSDKSLA